MFLSSTLIFFFCSIVVGQTTVEPYPVTGNVSIRDPTVCKDNNGTYWLFSTGKGLEIRSSPDRVAWTYEGAVFPNGSPWSTPYAPDGSLWAPDCNYDNGEFILYYTASTTGSQHSAIFLAKSSTGRPGDWTNEGLVIASSANVSYNCIDPSLLVDTVGKWYLSFGSYFGGIYDVEPSTGKLIDPSAAPILVARRRPDVANGTDPIEASSLYKVNSVYYLFSSWDFCCRGVNSTYNVRVGRSNNPMGPFVDKSGTRLTDGGGALVLSTHDHVIGPGGEDLFTDQDGPVMVYHYFNSTTHRNCTTDSGECAAAVQVGFNRVNFSSGWPVVF